MCLDHCRAPDQLAHERAMALKACDKKAAARAWSPSLPESAKPPIHVWPAYSIDAHARAAQIILSMHISELVEKAKDAMFWRKA